METAEEMFAKQSEITIPFQVHAEPPSNVIVDLCGQQGTSTTDSDEINPENVQIMPQPYMRQFFQYHEPQTQAKSCDEPIDLTHQTHVRNLKRECDPLEVNQQPPAKIFVRGSRGRRPRICYQTNSIPEADLQGLFKDVIELQTTESKQAEILKAAKSLFSKRTRTLYHWMYPNTPKPQIKQAVTKSWENLGYQEKQFYISQVLVRFGFPQCNLMVNPQLGVVLPPVPNTFENTMSARELQTAISSISGEPAVPAPSVEGKRKQGRPLGSKNKKGSKNSLKIAKDFQDDPELSNELEKFAISFDCFK